MSTRLLYTVALLFLACSAKPDPFRVQQQKVARADSLLRDARTQLAAMQDSLPVKIKQNIALGLPPEQAEAVERALVKSQETLVAAAERNLRAQQAFQDSLQKYAP